MKIKKLIKFLLRRISIIDRIRTKMSARQAADILESYSPAAGATCVGNNLLAPRYDLQIVVPAYNAEQYITACLNSVLGQNTRFSYIVTVVNDGSTDGTQKIINDFYIKNTDKMEVIEQKNCGFSGARNAGIKILKGRYITFLDSDDVMTDGAVENLLCAAWNIEGECFDVDIVQGCWCDIVDGKASKVNKTRELSGFPWGKIFKAELLKDFRFPVNYWFEDTPISFILYGKDLRTKVIDKLVYGYRINPEGITSTAPKSKRSVESYYVTELCLREMPFFKVRYDQRAYRYFLRQCVMNQRRALHRPRQIREAIFTLEMELRKQYFSGVKIDLNKDEADSYDNYLQNIEETLDNKWFSRFEILARAEY